MILALFLGYIQSFICINYYHHIVIIANAASRNGVPSWDYEESIS